MNKVSAIASIFPILFAVACGGSVPFHQQVIPEVIPDAGDTTDAAGEADAADAGDTAPDVVDAGQWLPACVINSVRYPAIETDAGQLVEPHYIEPGDGGCSCTVSVYDIATSTSTPIDGIGTCDLTQ